jgi:hypothetical protein
MCYKERSGDALDKYLKSLSSLPLAALVFCALHASAWARKDLDPDSCGARLVRPATASQLVERVVLLVIAEGQREDLAQLKKIEGGVRVTSEWGNYDIVFAKDEDALYPRQGLPALEWRRGRIYGKVILSEAIYKHSLVRMQGIVRSLFRADYLHPHNRPYHWDPTRPDIASYMQKSALEQLMALAISGAYRRGLMMPPGTGKTTVAAKHVQELWDYYRQIGTWLEPPKVLYVLENEEVLRRAEATFGRQLGFTRFTSLYHPNKPMSVRLDPAAQMIAVTRTTYFARREEIHRLLASTTAPWVLIADEAHQVGRRRGQFEKIMQSLAPLVSERLQLLMLTATPWRSDRDIIVDILNGKMAAPLLDPTELALLCQGQGLIELHRAQLFRSIEQGYLAPLFGVDIQPASKESAAEIFRMTTELRGNTANYSPNVRFLRELADLVREGRFPGIADRGVFFMPTTHQSRENTRVLDRYLDDVRPYFRGVDEEAETWRWFQQEPKYEDPDSDHRYLGPVDLLNVGVDVPEINLEVLMSRYSGTRSGFRRLIQHLGRATRVAWGKFFFRLIDPVGTTRLLRSGLARISVEAPKEEVGFGGFYRDRKGVRVGRARYTPVEFETEYFTLFPGEGTFFTQFPFYDPDEFSQGGLRALNARLPEYGIRSVREAWWPKNLAEQIAYGLSVSFPPSEERDELIDELLDADSWEWVKWDGALAMGKDGASRQRLYELFYLLAVFLKTQGSLPESFELRQVGTYEGVSEMLNLILPWKRSLYRVEEIEQFLAPGGDLAVLFGSISRFNITSLGTKKKVQDFAVRLISSVPVTPELAPLKTKILAEIKDPQYWRWDGWEYYARRSSAQDEPTRELLEAKASFQRLFRLVHIVRFLVERSGIAPAGTPLMNILDILRPQANQQVAPDYVQQFIDEETGGTSALSSRAAWFGIKHLQVDFAPRTIALKILSAITRSEERDEIIKLVKAGNYGWKKTDGLMLQRKPYFATTRFLRALSLAAVHLKNTDSRFADLNLATLFTHDGLSGFLDQVFLGAHLPVMSREQVELFKRREGAIGFLRQQTGPKTGVINMRHRYSLRDMFLYVAKGIESSAVSRQFSAEDRRLNRKMLKVLSDDALWGWSATDNEGIALYDTTSPKYYRAIYWLAVRTNASFGRPVVALDKIHTYEEFQKLFDVLIRD